MRIKYKQPYWIKFEWDLNFDNENQYVTEYNKKQNDNLNEFFHKKNFVINCEFRIENTFNRDSICMIYGKPGKQIGLSYNTETSSCAFEYWETINGVDEFRYLSLYEGSPDTIEKNMIVTIIRDGNQLIAYKNFKEVSRTKLDGDFVNDYKVPGFFLGCASPQSNNENTRYYCEVEFSHFMLLENTNNIEIIKEIYETETINLLKKDYYNDIICLYDFKTVNNIGIVYDESKNSNFLEKVPEEFIL